MTFAATAKGLGITLLLMACSSEPEANAAAKSVLTCSSVRSEHQKAREQLTQRVEEIRAADGAARKAGEPDLARDRKFQQLMADIERAEGRFAVRSKECVGD